MYKSTEQWVGVKTKQTTIINWYKEKGGSELLTNYRGITLISNLRKNFEYRDASWWSRELRFM